MKQADIFVNDIFCGILVEDEEGLHFSYDSAYLARPNAVAVSPTMPRRIIAYWTSAYHDYK